MSVEHSRIDTKEAPVVKNSANQSVSLGSDSAGPAALSYVLITPARNEAALIENTIKAVVAQTLRPVKWIIVSDGSNDGTDEVVTQYAAAHSWIELVRMPDHGGRNFGAKVHAFNAGYVRAKGLGYDVIGNLDADITFDKDYFDFLLRKFSDNPRLGVAGTPFRQGSHQYDYRFTSVDHVSGACQLFRRECFEAIGGYVPINLGGIDLAAVLNARMKGWQTRAFPERAYVHHRIMGTAERSVLMVCFKGGQGDYRLGTHPVWAFLRTFYQMTQRPIVVAACFRLAGFVWAMVSRVDKVLPPDLVQFRRAEQIRRLLIFARKVAHLQLSSTDAM